MFPIVSAHPFTHQVPAAEPDSDSFCVERFIATKNGFFRHILTPWVEAVVPSAPAFYPLPFGDPGYPPDQPKVHLTLDVESLRVLLGAFVGYAFEHAAVECHRDIVLRDGKLQWAGETTLSESSEFVEHQAPDIPRGLWPVDIHSHGHHDAYFSGTDDADDIYDIKIAVVVGNLTRETEYVARLCLGRGVFVPLDLDLVFPALRLDTLDLRRAP